MSPLFVAGLLGFCGVALGAFGAHVLRDSFTETAARAYQTAVLYHLLHAVVLVSLALRSERPGATLVWARRLIQTGIVLFSGSLYMLALTQARAFGWVTPFGGVAFLAGWVLVALGGVKSRR